ncbi:type III pantothenate kinase [Fulvivirgaceae bacterium LMO-SS25]
MLLAIDAGNTNIVFAIYTGTEWTREWRFETHPIVPALEYEKFLRFCFLENGFKIDQIDRVVISTVVPQITGILEDLSKRMFGIEALTIGMTCYPQLEIKLNNPEEIGTDLVANAVAAWTRFNNACIIVDFGTALTFTIVDSKGSVIGVSIAPGLRTAVKALSSNTAKLPYVPLELPKTAIGNDTVSAIQSGLLLGYTYMVKGMIGRIKSEVSDSMKVIATGGMSSILHNLEGEFDIIDRHLTLDGMRIIMDANS